MSKIYLLLLIALLTGSAFGQSITQAEYFVDTDPGAGNGTLFALSHSGADSAYGAFSFHAGSLSPGLHRLFVRYRDDSGVWTNSAAAYYFIVGLSTSNFQARSVTAAEYFVDTDPGTGNGIPFTLSHTGADSAWSAFHVPSAGSFPPGLHRIYVRYHGSTGAWTSAEALYYFIVGPNSSNYQPLLVTHWRFHFDTLAATTLDIPDSGTANIAQAVSSAGLAIGLHRFYSSYRDSRGIWGPDEGRYLFVASTPPTPFVSNHLTGGEYFVNVDPGVGNGIPLGAPDSSGWDSGSESVTFHLTGIPIGTHVIGLRFRDAFGLWSPLIQDTMMVGPILTVRLSGNDIILDWIPSGNAPPYHVWRANSSAGPFAEVDSTNNVTWTDVNAINLAPRHFYYVRQTGPGPVASDFRLPSEPRRAMARE